jgi:hypothetical protein
MDPTMFNHDGFFFRFGLGLGWGSFTSSAVVAGYDPLVVSGPVRAKGLAWSIELLFGGTPAPGLVLGSGLLIQWLQNPSLQVGGVEVSGTVKGTLAAAVGFADYYPIPRLGFHVQALFGPAYARLEWKENWGESGSLLVGLGAGIEGWVGPQLSLGGLLRLTYLPNLGAAEAKPDAAGMAPITAITTIIPALVATFH